MFWISFLMLVLNLFLLTYTFLHIMRYLRETVVNKMYWLSFCQYICIPCHLVDWIWKWSRYLRFNSLFTLINAQEPSVWICEISYHAKSLHIKWMKTINHCWFKMYMVSVLSYKIVIDRMRKVVQYTIIFMKIIPLTL
jgi:hypothetical protein